MVTRSKKVSTSAAKKVVKRTLKKPAATKKTTARTAVSGLAKKTTAKVKALPKVEAKQPQAVKAGPHSEKQSGLLRALAVYEQGLINRKKKQLTVEEMAKEIGVTRSALSNVMHGISYLPSCNRDVIEKFAKALEIPVLQIFVLCEFFKSTDYVYESNLEKDLETIYKAVLTKSQDFVFQVPQPSAWKKWPLSAKYHFVLMYEVAAQKNLLRKAMAIAPKDVHFVVPTKK